MALVFEARNVGFLDGADHPLDLTVISLLGRFWRFSISLASQIMPKRIFCPSAISMWKKQMGEIHAALGIKPFDVGFSLTLPAAASARP